MYYVHHFKEFFKEIISKSSMRAHLRKKNQIQLKFKLSLGYINPMSEKKKTNK